ncbi:hypothetical protein [Bythopirellula goksoeyrii]|uniref:SMP-30/Gluconolaconase/LRE-like region n=1 Tax=Bythopirellula goksoeyrii TaxID=1400387 RepID=A0A5B9QFI5_9BACT|nr:hypothetical protein [Bythopirellula goksoeyrii]QEG36659.1 hypothetical protein Pr1d_39740 [Bythopirellula goksoeyrii]
MNRFFAPFVCAVVSGLLAAGMPATLAQESDFPPAENETDRYQLEEVFTGLNNPAGLALRPPSGDDVADEFFFAESGAGRVLRFSVDSPTENHEVLNELTTHRLGAEDPIEVGPWALGFLTPSKLVVMGGVQVDGEEQVGVYFLPENAKVLSANQVDHSVGPLTTGDTVEQLGFQAVAVGETSAYFASGSENATGQIYSSPLEANQLDSFRPLLKEQITEWPAGLCLSPVNSAGSQYLVGSYLGELQEARDSRLVFFDPFSGSVLMQLNSGLFDLVGLAYSPSGRLYAIDFAWQKPEAGGVYRLDDARWEGRPACRAVKIAKVVRPTSLAFASDGTMYVTAFGSSDKPKQGKIVKITGEF